MQKQMNILLIFCQTFKVAFDRDSALNIVFWYRKKNLEKLEIKEEFLLLFSLACKKPLTLYPTPTTYTKIQCL